MAKRKKKKTKKERLRQKRKRYVREKEKQGYSFTDEFKDKLFNLKTAEALERWTPEKILAQATAISQETGEIISGTEAQKERRSLGAKRGWETRRTREYQKEHFDEPLYSLPQTDLSGNDYSDGRYHIYFSEPDDYDWDDFDESDEYDPIFEGEQIKHQLQRIVDAYMPRMGAEYLLHLINAEEKEFGNSFLISLAILDEEIVAEATTLASYESKDRRKANDQYTKMVNMLRGTMATESEAKEVGDILDDMEDAEGEFEEG